MTQLEFGWQLRDAGIAQAEESANQKTENWTQLAYSFLLEFMRSNDEFMAEDVRLASEGKVEPPPSNRAWGGIFVRAVKEGLIRRKGFRNVKNAKAHCTPATLWETIK
jgi:hypothetical protein